jgi:hypothetical protein
LKKGGTSVRSIEISKSPQDQKIRDTAASILPKPSSPAAESPHPPLSLEDKTDLMFKEIFPDPKEHPKRHRHIEMLLNLYQSNHLDKNGLAELILEGSDAISEKDPDREQLIKILLDNLTHYQAHANTTLPLSGRGGVLHIYPTLGDGTCGLHALLGDDYNNQYACDAKKAREEFCQWIKSAKPLPERIQNVLTDYFRDNFDLAPAKFQELTKAKHEKFVEEYGSLTTNQEKDARLEQYLQDEEVLNAYLETVRDTGQYLLQDELIAAAECFNKTLVLCQSGTPWGETDDVAFHETFNEGVSEPVYVWYNGVNHYERATFEP